MFPEGTLTHKINQKLSCNSWLRYCFISAYLECFYLITWANLLFSFCKIGMRHVLSFCMPMGVHLQNVKKMDLVWIKVYLYAYMKLLKWAFVVWLRFSLKTSIKLQYVLVSILCLEITFARIIQIRCHSIYPFNCKNNYYFLYS